MNFVGEKQGAPFSAYIVKAQPGPRPAVTHASVCRSRVHGRRLRRITVGHETREVKAGEHRRDSREHAAPLR